jgi:hypothetical protein
MGSWWITVDQATEGQWEAQVLPQINEELDKVAAEVPIAAPIAASATIGALSPGPAPIASGSINSSAGPSSLSRFGTPQSSLASSRRNS